MSVAGDYFGQIIIPIPICLFPQLRSSLVNVRQRGYGTFLMTTLRNIILIAYVVAQNEDSN